VDGLAEHVLAIEQLGYADVVVLSRADACADEVMARATEVVASRNGAALVVRAARGDVVAPPVATLDALLDARRDDFAGARELPAAAAHVYESVSLALDGEVDGERFADFVESELAPCAGRLFRTKGIVAVAGVEERMIVQGVADLVEVAFGAPWAGAPRASRLVVVGFGLDCEALAEGLAACAAARVRQDDRCRTWASSAPSAEPTRGTASRHTSSISLARISATFSGGSPRTRISYTPYATATPIATSPTPIADAIATPPAPAATMPSQG
jgi:hypothetical protein